ncbi:hypothetical protein [Pseudomonas sp. Marseille-Q5117]|uniref:hypothetical protein n=1 Tax=Pseudomonas sp. Marseille-Q5117 TaxID=2972777 RepID=UPI0021C95145|nr:hypothetical protein [Pseudomonas sp. Marseille-Q5117]
MTSSKTTFEAPHLKNTDSPTIVSHTEFTGGKAALMASYLAKEGDQVTFVIQVDSNVRYEKLVTVSPGGATAGEVGTKLNPVDDWQLVAKTVTTYFTVSRKGLPVGQSQPFEFTVANA